jgi:hypothetical protein
MRFSHILFLLTLPAFGQDMPMPGHDMPMQGHDMPMHHHHSNFAGNLLMNQASGTSINPTSWQMPMWMSTAGSWNLMLMGNAFVVDTQQSGPRGGDKLYSANMFMLGAEHGVGRGSVMIDTMLSLEPATVESRRYPLLFQTGETAYGQPLVDAQHPHNFVANLGIHYARPVGPAVVQFYYAPVGDPALGPVAYPHRASAAELPQAPIGHHWQDSTHIGTNVVTAAVRYRKLRIEASGFHGAEPGENRWTINWGGVDSWSTRFSVMPTGNWLLQVSQGRLADPERVGAGTVVRTTASAHYTRGEWSSSFVWGRNAELNSWLAETVAPAGRRNWVTGRFEVVDKDELEVAGVWRVAAYTAGYTRDVAVMEHFVAGVGVNGSVYGIPAGLRGTYGERPAGVNVFLRLRLK